MVSWLVALLVVAAVCSGVVAGLVWQHREERGAEAFFVVMVAGAVWAISYALALLTTDPGARLAVELAVWLVKSLIPVAWIVFALQYTGRGNYVSRRTVAVLLVPAAVTMVVIPTNQYHGLFWQGYELVSVAGVTAATYEPGPWFALQVLYSYLLIGIGGAALLEVAVGGTSLYRTQAAVLLLGPVFPLVANVKWLFGYPPVAPVDFSSVGFVATGVLYGYVLFRYEVFERIPAIERVSQRTIFEDLGDGVIVTDRDGQVVDANRAAERIVDTPAEQLRDQRVDRVLGADEFSLSAGEQTVTLVTDGVRQYSVTTRPVSDVTDDPIGYALVLHDVTEENHRRQRIEVLSRVLRHNLRNKMTTIIGHAELIGEQADALDDRFVDRIVEESTDLVTLSDKARRLEEVTEGASDRERFDVAEAADSVARRIEDETRASVTVSAPDDLAVTSAKRVVTQVLWYATQALLAYNDAAEPTVRIEVVRADAVTAGVSFVITDDGDGIPPNEWRAVESGTESKLHHSNIVDLWLVTWGVEALGGRIHGDEYDSEIEIAIPDADADTQTDTDTDASQSDQGTPATP